MAISKSQAKATAKYEKNNYFKTLVRFKKEDEERIRAAAGDSLNGFIVKCVLDALDKPEVPTQAPESVPEAVKPSKPGLLPLTPENVRKIDYRLFIDDWNYQFKIIELFGEDAAYKLRSMTESEFKTLANSDKL